MGQNGESAEHAYEVEMTAAEVITAGGVGVELSVMRLVTYGGPANWAGMVEWVCAEFAACKLFGTFWDRHDRGQRMHGLDVFPIWASGEEDTFLIPPEGPEGAVYLVMGGYCPFYRALGFMERTGTLSYPVDEDGWLAVPLDDLVPPWKFADGRFVRSEIIRAG